MKKTTRKPSIPKQFLGAFKAGHRSVSRDLIDETLSYELLNKILDSNWTDLEAIKNLEYITKFNNEYHKNVIKKGDPNALHNTDELRKDCYNRENARNRDLTAIQRDKLLPLNQEIYNDEEIDKDRNLHNHEDQVIEIIDLKDETKKSKKQ